MLADELRVIANKQVNHVDEIINEILSDFREYCRSGKMDDYIRRYCADDLVHEIIMLDRKFTIWIRYDSRENSFRVGKFLWKKKEQHNIDLDRIKTDVCKHLYYALRDHLILSGFNDLDIGRMNQSDKSGNVYDITVNF